MRSLLVVAVAMGVSLPALCLAQSEVNRAWVQLQAQRTCDSQQEIALSQLTNALASATKVEDIRDAIKSWAAASESAIKDKKDKSK